MCSTNQKVVVEKMKLKIKKIKEITIKMDSEEALALFRVLRSVDCDDLINDYVEMIDGLCSELRTALED